MIEKHVDFPASFLQNVDMLFAPKRLSRHGKSYANTATAICGTVLLCVVFFSSPVHAQSQSTAAPGIAWNVQGEWHALGAPAALHTGDPIWTNSLLEPEVSAAPHSITLLLPDGQSILYQCYTPADCARGFRVPALFRSPEPFAVQMLARIRAAVLQQRKQDTSPTTGKSQQPKDEIVAALGPEGRIEIGGLAAKLPNGDYFGDLKSFDAQYPEQARIALHKSGPSVALTVPGPGLYLLNITDSRNWPRINFMIAVESVSDASLAKDLQQEHALLAAWIHRDFFGWPMHEFQRAYLESRTLNIPTAPMVAPRLPKRPHADVTGEPTFSPSPGVVAGNINITLHSATPGATIHYTLGPAEPMASSPVASASIVMTTLPMTIKAFASAPGKKDSPVVTANFRVEGED